MSVAALLLMCAALGHAHHPAISAFMEGVPDHYRTRHNDVITATINTPAALVCFVVVV